MSQASIQLVTEQPSHHQADQHRPAPDSEVAHSIGEGERLVADAVLHYSHIDGEGRRKLRAFVEVDRTTMSSERLAVKLIDYARLFHHEAQPAGRRRPTSTGPAWLRWYPILPRVLFVLTGATRTRLEHRIGDLQAMAAQHPLVAALGREAPLGATVLEDIESTARPHQCGYHVVASDRDLAAFRLRIRYGAVRMLL